MNSIIEEDEDLTPEQIALLSVDERLRRAERAIRDMVDVMRREASKGT